MSRNIIFLLFNLYKQRSTYTSLGKWLLPMSISQYTVAETLKVGITPKLRNQFTLITKINIVDEDLNQIQNSTAILTHHFNSCGYHTYW